MNELMRWEFPEYAFVGLAIILFLIIAIYLYQRWLHKKDEVFTKVAQERLSVEPNKNRKLNPYWWWLPVVVLLTLALMNFQTQGNAEPQEIEGTDLYIALDISNSMLARDVSPSRIERAKHFSTQLIKEMQGNKVGLIYFAGGAFRQSPLTSDFGSLMNMINAASPHNAGVQGTNIGEAVRLAFDDKNDDKSTSAKALIIITDGEDHDENSLTAVREASAKGMGVYVVGVGTEKGAPIPDYSWGMNNYKTDNSGQPIVSKLNTEMCKTIAKEGNGKAYILKNTSSIVADVKLEIDKLEKRTTQTFQFKLYESYFPWFLFAGLLFFVFLTFKEFRS